MAACLWQAHPQGKVMDIFNAIQKSAHQYNTPDTLLGYGIPNFVNAYFILLKESNSAIFNNEFPIVLPNPFDKELFLYTYSDISGEITINIYDVLGRRVMNKSYDLIEGSYQIHLIETDIITVRGIYFIDVLTAQEKHLLKVMKR